MKVSYLTILISLFLSFINIEIQAQTMQTKLDQIVLMKQFLGSWKCEVSKDTTAFWDAKSYGTGFENKYNYVTNGKIFE